MSARDARAASPQAVRGPALLSSASCLAARLLLAASLFVASGAAAAPPQYTSGGEKACLDCHGNERVMAIMGTVHMKEGNPDAPAAQKACESCHGPSEAHVQFPMQVENLHFGKKSMTAATTQNHVCLECHAQKDKERANWKASAHGFENVVCSTCHGIHNPKKLVPPTQARISGCQAAGCHDKLMALAEPNAVFTHAVGKPIDGKGELTCTGCHNPHGPLSSGRCVDCHPQTPDMLAKESEKARRFHKVASERGTECIRCHKALSHPIRPLEMQKQEERIREHEQSPAG